jgi:hypothetical protein
MVDAGEALKLFVKQSEADKPGGSSSNWFPTP